MRISTSLFLSFLFSLLVFSSCAHHVCKINNPNEVYGADFSFVFKGKKCKVHLEIPTEVYDCVSDRDRSVYYVGAVDLNYEYEKRLNDKVEVPYIKDLISQIRKCSGPDDNDFIEAAVLFVQKLAYDRKSLVMDSAIGNKYPIETLLERSGVCGDKSLLLGSLFYHSNIKFSFFFFYDTEEPHMAVGVGCDKPTYEGYCYVETTDYFPIGAVPFQVKSMKLSRQLTYKDNGKIYSVGSPVSLDEASDILYRVTDKIKSVFKGKEKTAQRVELKSLSSEDFQKILKTLSTGKMATMIKLSGNYTSLPLENNSRLVLSGTDLYSASQMEVYSYYWFPYSTMEKLFKRGGTLSVGLFPNDLKMGRYPYLMSWLFVFDKSGKETKKSSDNNEKKDANSNNVNTGV